MHLVLLPGLDGTGDLFAPFLAALPPGLTASVVSYPCEQHLDYDQLFALVEAALPTDRPYLVLGESFSGPLAIRIAARPRPGLRGWILNASFVRSPIRFFPAALRFLVRPLFFRITPPFLIDFFLVGPRKTPIREQLHAALRRVSPAVLAARVRDVLAVDVREELKACPVPGLYLRAGEDRLVSSASLAEVRKVRPDLAVAIVPAPHLLLQLEPDKAITEIGGFVNRLVGKANSSD